MKNFLSKDVAKAITDITSNLGITLDEKLQKDYQNGRYPNLLSYEKVEKPSIDIPAIQKYLIGATTYLHQPCQYYDIYRACRHVQLIQILNNALTTVIQKTINYEPRIEKLLKETQYDSFESIMYEVIVAAIYAKLVGVKEVNFLDEQDTKSPDFEVVLNKSHIFVECKKINRNADIVNQLRNDVRDKTRLTMHAFAGIRQSALIEISFHFDPKLISDSFIRDACIDSFRSRAPIVEKVLTVTAKSLIHKDLDQYALYPSPKYFYERYGYKTNDEWFGIVHTIEARFANHIDVQGLDYKPSSTWLDEVNFECALKWKITDENIIWRHKKFGYDTFFKGLDQLQAKGTNSVLHVWYERENSVGHRQNELLDFFNRLNSNQRDVFGWIIFNETIFDVSVGGRFDLIEHAHPIRGPGAITEHPLVTGVFIADDEHHLKNGEFGIGHNLPDIDQYYSERIK